MLSSLRMGHHADGAQGAHSGFVVPVPRRLWVIGPKGHRRRRGPNLQGIGEPTRRAGLSPLAVARLKGQQ